MDRIPRLARLDDLTEYPLGGPRSPRRKNVPFKLLATLDEFRDHEFSSFAWWNTRDLENRSDVSVDEGVWPINHSRCDRKFGDPGNGLYPQFEARPPADFVTEDVWKAASKFRLFCYWRVPDSVAAIRHLAAGRSVRYAGEITSDWYDPPDGKISVSSDDLPILGSHSVPLAWFDGGECRFHFRNSWGVWGDHGWGSFDRGHFDRSVVEAWDVDFRGVSFDRSIGSGIVCLEWKWAVNDEIAVHGCEVVDGATDDRLAWAFCVKRGRNLDVDEFFVWPTERGKGYGRVLAGMVKGLAVRMKMPLRALVSFADTEADNLPALNAAARLLGVELAESRERWVHLIGTPTVASRSQAGVTLGRRRPKRPAFLVELLRPKDEAPITEPIRYTVFFGTNRERDPAEDGPLRFSGRRGDSLTLGSVSVDVPTTHRFGSTGSWWVKVWRHLFETRPTITETRVIGSANEFCEVTAQVMGDYAVPRPHNLLFIHGYRVSFDDAVKQAATLGVDLKTPGATFLYSWPSAGRLASYAADEAAIEASLPYLDEFVRMLLAWSAEIPLSIIAHSMGNRAILRYLDGLANSQAAKEGRIDQLVFAAPDVDADVFKSSAQKTARLAERATLYVTRADLAVRASELLHGYARAGLAPPVTTADAFDTVMVEGFNLLDLGHGYFASAGPVMHDLFQLLHYRAAPRARAGVYEAATTDGRRYWKIRLP